MIENTTPKKVSVSKWIRFVLASLLTVMFACDFFLSGHPLNFLCFVISICAAYLERPWSKP